MAGKRTPQQKPATNDSPIKAVPRLTGKIKQSDPPAPQRTGNTEGGSDLARKGVKPTTATPSAQPTGDIVSRPDIQYVPSSITVNRYIRGDLILPQTLDEAELQNSIAIYDEMLLDPTIAGVRLWMNVNVLADGLTLDAAEFEPEPGQEEADQADVLEAQRARRYIKAAYRRLKYTDRDIMLTLWDLLDGARIPHKLAEATYDTQRFGEYAGLPGIGKFKTKPRINYNLVFDTFNTFRGIVAVVPGGSLAKWSGFIFDASVLPNAVAAEKIVLFMADDRDGLPRSLYNAAYGPWRRMLDLYVEMMSTAHASAGGKVSLELGDKAAQQFTDPVTGQTVTAEQAANNALSQFDNDGTLVHMNGSTLTVWYPQANALNTFIDGIKMCKREIWTALTTNDKTAMEGEHGSGLSESESSDDAQPVIEMLKSKLCLAIDTLSYNLLKLAKGEEYATRYCPSASMRRGDVMDFPASGTAWAAIATSEGYTPSQLPDFARLVGIKPPNAAEMAIIGETWLAQQKMTAEPPPAPVVSKPDGKPSVKAPQK